MRVGTKEFALGLSLTLTGFAVAQSPAGRPYDGIQAGVDAFKLAEEKRRADVAGQLFISDQMRYWAGLPTSRGETIYYGNYGFSGAGFATPLVPPASLEYTYAYGGRGYWVRTRQRLWLGPLTVFEPWPLVPGDIYGYRDFGTVRQPIGQQQTQTGPRRWESHPVYDPPLANLRPLPPVDSPLLDKTPFAAPRRGPREY